MLQALGGSSLDSLNCSAMEILQEIGEEQASPTSRFYRLQRVLHKEKSAIQEAEVQQMLRQSLFS